MKLYLYDEITKEYTHEIEAYIDPEETKLAGKEVYMYPANSTDLEPPIVGLNEIVLFATLYSPFGVKITFFGL